MAVKHLEIEGIGMVSLVKSRASRNLRLSITPTGVRVSMPWWTNYQTGLQFLERHREWIISQRSGLTSFSFTNGQPVGKTRTLVVRPTIKTTGPLSRLHHETVEVLYAKNEQPQDRGVQQRIEKAVRRALRAEAEAILPERLAGLAERHRKTYRSVAVKHLKRRWGSCSTEREIVLNLYLMQLPWEQIDYVLLHELAHTEVMNHGPDFWHVLLDMEPRARALGKLVRKTQPK